MTIGSVTAPTGGKQCTGGHSPSHCYTTGAGRCHQASGTDADGDTISYIIVVPPTACSVGRRQPDLHAKRQVFCWTDSFSYKVNDGQVDSPAVSVSIVVNDTVQGQDENEIFLPIIRR